jgi:hypothetical protein
MVGFISERVACFRLECMAGFVGIRTEAEDVFAAVGMQSHNQQLLAWCRIVRGGN